MNAQYSSHLCPNGTVMEMIRLGHDPDGRGKVSDEELEQRIQMQRAAKEESQRRSETEPLSRRQSSRGFKSLSRDTCLWDATLGRARPTCSGPDFGGVWRQAASPTCRWRRGRISLVSRSPMYCGSGFVESEEAADARGKVRVIIHRIRRLEIAHTPDEQASAAVQAILAARRKRLGARKMNAP